VTVAGLIALGLSSGLTPLVILGLHRWGILDHPNARSSHDEPIVRGGGIAFAIACVGAVAITEAPFSRIGTGVVVAGASLAVIGLVEDLRGIPAGPRFASQLLAAALALVWLLSGLDGPFLWQIVFGLGSLAALSSYANAFNFMDGINGISAMQSLVAGATWAWLGEAGDAPVLVWGGLALAGASLGYLPYNFPRARVFLGDSGSYFIGGWQAALIIAGLRADIPPEAMGAPVAIYLADTGTTLIKRVLAGEVWHEPHREHAYQRLIRRGWSHVRTTALVTAFVAACAALGLGSRGPLTVRVVTDVLLAAVVLLYLALPRLNERRLERTST
jgi:UDP-N-acetylmuramyl pentapeptide phosphotransferase/UDP-N-acetylglucosamine-1-phosphate transferase